MVFSRKNILACFLVLALFFSVLPSLAYASATTTGNTSADFGKGCSLTQVFTNVGTCLLAPIVNTVLGFFSFILGISAFILNYVLTATVVNLAKNIKDITAIPDAWGAIRDIINLTFIFILLFAAIRTILGLESPEKVIKNIVLAAIFINFSMFFTRVLIDASNSITLFLYSNLVTSTPAGGSAFNEQGGIAPSSLVNAYVTPLKLQTLFSSGKVGDTNVNPQEVAVDWKTIVTVGILGSLMLGLVAFVFLTISFMFILRYVVLVLMLIFSPLGFVSKDLPFIGGYQQQWWKILKAQLLFPPIFMIITWIALKVISNLPKSTDATFRSAFASSGSAPTQDNIALIVNFIVILVLIIMSLTTTIETAQQGSQTLSKLYGRATKWAGAAMFGSAGLLGRTVLGGTAAGLARTGAFKRFEAEAPNNIAARLALSATDRLRTGSFDVRATGFGKGFGRETGMDAGEAGGKGGAEAAVTVVREFAGARGTETRRKIEERGRKAQNERDVLIARGAHFDEADQAELNALDSVPVATRTPSQQSRLNELTANRTLVDGMERAISRMTDKEVEAMLENNRQLLDSPIFAQKVSVQQLEAVNKSDKFSEQEKDTLKRNRFAVASTIMTGTPHIFARKKIQEMADKELEMIDSATLENTEFIKQLKQSQVDAIIKSNKFTSSQKSLVKETRKNQLSNMLTSGHPDYDPVSARKQLAEIETKDWPKLDIKILTKNEVVPMYTAEKLKRLAPDLTPENIQKIRTSIENAKRAIEHMVARGGYTKTGEDLRVEKVHHWMTTKGMTEFI